MAKVNGEACPLTGESAEITDGAFDGWTVTGPYTDGPYRIARSVIEQIRALPPSIKAKVVSWVIDRRRAGETDPLITSQTIQDVLGRGDLTYDQRLTRFFLFLKKSGFALGKTIRISGIVDADYLATVGRLSAWMEVEKPGDVMYILRAIVSEGLLSDDGNGFRLTAEGIRRLDMISSTSAGSNQAFVAMWFAPEMDAAYDEGFEPAILDNGYRALRIDKKEHSNKIDDEIISEIRRSRFIVADFTCGLLHSNERIIGVPRGGVYYEAGFAQGLNIDVIWTVRNDCIDHVHFDTRQYSHIVWTDPADLRLKLKNRIGAVLGRAA